jgi:single-strand DNA-binding protein
MANVNKVILIGRLGNQPELRYTPSNRAVTELRLAVNSNWTDRNGQRQEKTDWFSVELWDKQAETAERYLQKGREVYVEGRLSNDEWTDKEGQKRSKTKIIGDRMQFIGNRQDGPSEPRPPRSDSRSSAQPRGDSGPAPGMAADPSDFGPPPADDDIPF